MDVCNQDWRMLNIGLSYTSYHIVTLEDTVNQINGVCSGVLDDSRVLALAENASVLALDGFLNDDTTTIGVGVEFSSFFRPEVGSLVQTTSVLTGFNEERLDFHVVVSMDGLTIGEGYHFRNIVHREDFK